MLSKRVLSLVDDDESMRAATKRLISSVGLEVEDFASAEDFLDSDRCHDSACLILDLRLPGIDGLELQSRLTAANSKVPIVFISGHGDGHERARALEAGAIDFLQKPFSEQDLFKAIGPFVGDAARVGKMDGACPANHPARPQLKNVPARSRANGNRNKFLFEQILGESEVMQEMLRLARRVAESQVSTVLLQGDSGTGKDLIAKAIHHASRGADRSF